MRWGEGAKDEFLKKRKKYRLRIVQNLLEWGEVAKVGCKSKGRTHIAKMWSDCKVRYKRKRTAEAVLVRSNINTLGGIS